MKHETWLVEAENRSATGIEWCNYVVGASSMDEAIRYVQAYRDKYHAPTVVSWEARVVDMPTGRVEQVG